METINNNGWTPERRKRQAELIRDWMPWEHSTGAQTEKGKDISKMNAYKHGLRSEGFKAIKYVLKNKTLKS